MFRKYVLQEWNRIGIDQKEISKVQHQFYYYWFKDFFEVEKLFIWNRQENVSLISDCYFHQRLINIKRICMRGASNFSTVHLIDSWMREIVYFDPCNRDFFNIQLTVSFDKLSLSLSLRIWIFWTLINWSVNWLLAKSY